MNKDSTYNTIFSSNEYDTNPLLCLYRTYNYKYYIHSLLRSRLDIDGFKLILKILGTNIDYFKNVFEKYEIDERLWEFLSSFDTQKLTAFITNDKNSVNLSYFKNNNKIYKHTTFDVPATRTGYSEYYEMNFLKPNDQNVYKKYDEPACKHDEINFSYLMA